MWRTAGMAALLVVHAIGAAAPAGAGGTNLSPVRDRYEVGEIATFVGYTSGGQLGWVEDGPFYAYLVADETSAWANRTLPVDSVPLGRLTLEERGRTLRVNISFPVPGHLVPGIYTITYCNAPCTTGLGDLIGGWLAIGVDPPREVQREWFLDDPEIANLTDDAILTGPGYRVTAGDVRAGRVTAPAGWGRTTARPLGPDQRPASPWAQPQPQPQIVPATATTLPPLSVDHALPDAAAPADPHGAGWPWVGLVLVGSAMAVRVVFGLWRVFGRRPTRRLPPATTNPGTPRVSPESADRRS